MKASEHIAKAESLIEQADNGRQIEAYAALAIAHIELARYLGRIEAASAAAFFGPL